jgi:excisionase family DNA binding protein
MKENLSFERLPQIVNDLTNEIMELKNLLEGIPQPSPSQITSILTVDDTAVFLDLKKPTIYSKVSRGELPHIKRNGRLYFERQKLIEYLESGRVMSDAEIKENAHTYLTRPKKGGAQ